MLVLTLIVGNYFWAQIGMGQWRLHVASGKAVDIVVAENTVFTAYTNGFAYFKSEHGRRGAAHRC
jgi:hypothetical protein